MPAVRARCGPPAEARRPSRVAALTAILAALAPALSGCRGTPDPVRAQDGRVALSQVDYRFRPQNVRTAAGQVTITVTNRGRLPHTLRVVRNGRQPVRVSALLPGESEAVRVRLRRGTYRMLCAIGNHEELGMYGTLVVG